LEKATLIKKGVDRIKQEFQPLFLKGLPDFWDPKGKLIPREKYVELMNHERLDHTKFGDLEGGLRGEAIVNKHSVDFELLIQFR